MSLLRKLLLLSLLGLLTLAARADHIIGGEMFYTLLDSDATTNTYSITLKLFVRCDASDAQFEPEVNISVYTASGGLHTILRNVRRNRIERFLATDVDPCIINPPYICYQIGFYSTTVRLPKSANGYTAAYQRCCRRTNLTNINARNNNVGGTYFTNIHGDLPNNEDNSSPRFDLEKGVIVCANRPFRYEYNAVDPDGDSLAYAFAPAYSGATRDNPMPEQADAPPYYEVNYNNNFSSSEPMGDRVTIDPKTGLISGIAPQSGLYIVTVVAREYRRGILIGEHRKEFQITVETCVRQVIAAMPDKFADCDGLVINFPNNSTPNKDYIWDFGDGNRRSTNSLATFPYRYADTGTYRVKLIVDPASSCGDSAFATVRVYPFLNPDMDISGLCTTKPTNFNNTSTNTIGSFEYLKWDFGVPAIANDTSNLQRPAWQYTQPGNYDVSLFMRTTKGCERKIQETVLIYDKPPLTTTQDTLLCILNSLQLRAESTVPGTFTWSPLYNITGANTARPVAFPRVDTTYEVTFTDGTGCVNTQRVKVDVRSLLQVRTMPDSTICTGDMIPLRSETDGPYEFTWTNLDTRRIEGRGANIMLPVPRTTSYEIRAQLGDCEARDTVNYKAVDPPRAFAGLDTTVCFNEKLTLIASGGAFYQWSPEGTLTTPRQRTTIAWPKDTTVYTVIVTDTLGCPKPVSASRKVNVVPPVPAFAGNDTIIMKGAPLHLGASGGVGYQWSPATGLTDANVRDPFTFNDRDITYRVRVTTAEGCVGYDDIFVRWMHGPAIHIPNAFTPNGDGVNDIFRALPVGIVNVSYFRIYNRWGQLVYDSPAYLKGWDGTINGKKGTADTYVWIIGGLDVGGKTLEKSGTVTLLR